MSVDSLIFWLFVVAWVGVAAVLFFVLLPRLVGEVRHIVKHVVALIEGSPLPLKLSKAAADAARIEAAVARLPALRDRAQVALTAIRTAPLIPPQLLEAIVRVQTEIDALRRAERRRTSRR